MKSLLTKTAVIIIMATLTLPTVGLAQTSTTTAAARLQLIIQLRAQIQALQLQLTQLRASQQEQIAGFLADLKEGSIGDQVSLLQALLAADPSIYPEGLITGRFGKLTAAAVKRFQRKHGLLQLGQVGKETRTKLNEWLKEHPLRREDDEDDEDDDNATSTSRGPGRLCAIVPPGHLIAPGWLRKHDGIRPLVPTCQKLPRGIEKKLDDDDNNSTTTPDTVAPVISNIATSNLASTTATVSWTTNEAARGKIYYGTASPLSLTASTTSTVSSNSLASSKSLNLESLTASTTYYFVVEAKDGANNVATSSERSLVTTGS
ncbi:MAG: peptidoglycan-binding protein [Candidatus Vogelbacteria bacterium]|nr:peptidoglycan-binding protein [Candidatus Vogelbacteria bacterium]